MQDHKKQLEILLIQYFRDCCPAFPKGSVVASESPDFIVRAKHGKKVGVELVRLFPAITNSVSGSNQTADLRNELIGNVKELFERFLSFNLFVKFYFSENKQIAAERLLTVSARVAATLKTALTGKNEQSFFVHHLTSNKLPEGIDEVLVVHHPKLSESVWEEVRSVAISENNISEIARLIQKKEEKMYLYRKKKLDEYWLLIVTDHLLQNRNVKISDLLSTEDFRSEFQKVFLFDVLNSKISEL